MVFKTFKYCAFLTACLWFVNSFAHKNDSTASTSGFIKNNGQWDNESEFLLNLHGADIYLEKHAFQYFFENTNDVKNFFDHGKNPHLLSPAIIRCHAVRMEFENTYSKTAVSARYPKKFHANFITGNDEKYWKSNVPVYGEILYHELYRGIDMAAFQENSSGLKYEFYVSPGADPGLIRMNYTGAEKISIRNSNLHIKTTVNNWVETKPYAYQRINGIMHEVKCNFALENNTVSFKLGEYDHSIPLVIDPELIFSTYSGSVSNNFGHTATYDLNGNFYTAGIVRNPSAFPQGKYPVTAGAFQVNWGGGDNVWPQPSLPCDMGISKYNNDGTQLLFATYLGGNKNDYPISITVDEKEQLVVFGVTLSTNFPVTKNAYDTTKSDSFDIVVTRFTADGSKLVGSTYFGGTGIDGLNIADSLRMNYSDELRGDVMITGKNEVVFVSSTTSPALATSATYQVNNNGKQDGIIVKLDSALTRVIRSTYVGKSNNDALYSMDIDAAGNFVVAGGTQSKDFTPSAGSNSANYKGGISEGFVVKIDSSLKTLQGMRYWGTPEYDQVFFVKLDPQGNVVVFGQAFDSIQTTPGVYKNSKGTLFITKFSQDLLNIIWSTQLGNGLARNALSPSAFMVDVCGYVYGSVWGGAANYLSHFRELHPGIFNSNTSSLPVTPNALQITTDGSDFWLFCLKPDADSLTFGTFFGEYNGRDHVDGGTSRFDKRGIIYQSVCASCASGTFGSFPTTINSYSPNNKSPLCSNASFKIDFRQNNLVSANFNILPRNGCTDSVVVFENKSNNGIRFYWYLNDSLIESAINPGPGYSIQRVISQVGTYTVKLVVIDETRCNGRDSLTKTFTVLPSSNAAFSLTKDSCSALLFFKNQSTYYNNQVLPFTWYFGDGNKSYANDTVYRYAYNGVYNIMLITGEAQCADTAAIQINYDTLQYILKADIASKDTLRCEPNLLRLESNGRGGTDFNWFVNGVLVSKSRLFDSVAYKGVYKVKLVVNDSTTCTNSDSFERTFYILPPTYAEFDWTADTCQIAVQFFNRSLILPGDSAAYYWDFGDGTYSSDSSPYHRYADTGNYTVIMYANKNFPCTEKMEKTVHVSAGTSVLHAGFSLAPKPFCEPDTLIATNKSINTQKTYWYVAGVLEDSSSANEFRKRLSYPGTTEVKLIAYSENTCVHYDTAIKIIESFPSANASFTLKRDTCSPRIILTNTSTSNSQTPPSYQWYFGDGDATNDVDPVHEYASNGSYLIMLITNMGSPCADTAFQQITYDNNSHVLDAAIVLNDSLFCTPAYVKAARTGVNGKQFYWLLNDMLVSVDSIYADTFETQGKYTLKLVVIDSSTCSLTDTVSKEIEVVLFTRAGFKMERDSCSLDVQFVNLSADNGSNYTWYFGDGDSSHTRNPLHKYAVSDTYKVLLITGEGTFCADTATQNYFIDGDTSQLVTIPNVFTPNGDGLNDCYKINGVSRKCDEFQILVYNRWGLEVYRDTNGENCWNGKDKQGDDLPEGVYYYVIVINKKDGYKLNDRGTITLIRE